jgi:hypothetical protein
MAKFFFSLFILLPFAPPVLAVIGGGISLRLSRCRWIVHTITLVAMILALPVYIYLEGVVDPTTVEYPGPGDGFVVLFYLASLLLTAIGYLPFCFFTRAAVRGKLGHSLN